MIKAVLRHMWGVVAFLGIIGCAMQPLSPPPAFQPEPVQAGTWKQKADHLVFILDASSSMEDGYNGVQKFAMAKHVVANFNQTMPEMNIRTAVRSFGHDSSVGTAASTMNLFGPAGYSRSGVAESLKKVAVPGGTSPLDAALRGAGADLKDAQGNIAIIVVSDGEDMGAGVLAAADALKKQFNERLCIYTVQVGNHPAGNALLTKVASLTGCGAKLDADALSGGKQMAGFVRQVLLAELQDSDGDGVADVDDRCPGTPKGVAVDASGCPLDSDGDGVADYLDRCPGTPVGVAVDKDGCPVPKAAATPTKSAVVTSEGTWIFKGVQFETNSAELKTASYPVLDEIVAGMKEQPELRVEIQGHTDSRGSKALNDRLSQQRAESVMAYLVSKGISRDRLTARGYGPDKPVASNDTVQGRAENRRVELKPLK
jgi:OmpA-OmpF porin, OOP family